MRNKKLGPCTTSLPAWRMKMKEQHIVPLNRQMVVLLEKIRATTGNNPYDLVFPSYTQRGKKEGRYICENVFRKIIIALGYQGKMTAHGFRSTASTILNENGFAPDVIERQLAHTERNLVRAAYNHAQYLKERREMIEWWGNYLGEMMGL